MNEIFRQTVRSFLFKERPSTPGDAISLLDDWFSRYDLDPDMLAEEVDRHFGGDAIQGDAIQGDAIQ